VPVAVVSDEVSEGTVGLSHASVALGVPNEGFAGHWIVLDAIVEVQAGETVSWTVMVCEVEAVKLQESVAVQERTTL
jgi:hypothetical protein